MDDDDHYGPHHLTDLITAHTYSNADITGKWGNVVYLAERDLTIDYQIDREESFGAHIPGATMFMRDEFLRRYRFYRVNRAIDSTLLSRVKRDRGLLYSTHRYNFIRVRHSGHTFVRSDAEFLARSSNEWRRGLQADDSML
jgi:hypothetical protein